MGLSNIVLAVNRSPLCAKCFRVRLQQGKFVAPTVDRLLYLFLMRLGIMGRTESRFLRENISNGSTVVDIGANVGVYTLLLSRLVGDSGHVHAFEPDPLLYAALRRNLELNGITNVTTHAVAAGAEAGTLVLRRSAFNSGDNRIELQADPSGQHCDVEVRRLDEVLEGVEVDFVKIDVQGWERNVLKGMEGLLLQGHPNRLYMEFWPGGCRRVGYSAVELVGTLELYGYDVRPIDTPAPSSRPGWESLADGMGHHKFTDIVATRRTASP